MQQNVNKNAKGIYGDALLNEGNRLPDQIILH